MHEPLRFFTMGGHPLPIDPDTSSTGFLPFLFSADDPRPAREQAEANYAHGGGWNPIHGFTEAEMTLYYPNDPPLRPMAKAQLSEEWIVLYQHGIVAIYQADGSFEVARMD